MSLSTSGSTFVVNIELRDTKSDASTPAEVPRRENPEGGGDKASAMQCDVIHDGRTYLPLHAAYEANHDDEECGACEEACRPSEEDVCEDHVED